MVSQQATHNDKPSHPTGWPRSGDDESVRITAEIRRQVLVEFLAKSLAVQRVIAEGLRIDREAERAATEDPFLRSLYTTADQRISNAAAVQQWIASHLAAFGGDENRDFLAVAK